MEEILQNSRTDSTHLRSLLESERAQTQALERELAAVRGQLSSHVTALSRGQVENAQLRGEFEVVQGSLGGVEESMTRATETIRNLQQVRGRG